MTKWIAFALEGTLAQPGDKSRASIGKPVPEMVAKVRELLKTGHDVRILTDRAKDAHQAAQVKQWLADVGLAGLPLIAHCDDSTMAFVKTHGAKPDNSNTVPALTYSHTVKTKDASQRMSVMCPHCNGPSRVRSSRQVSKLLREVYCQCQDVECGHTFKAVLEVVRTISPSGKPDAQIDAQINASK